MNNDLVKEFTLIDNIGFTPFFIGISSIVVGSITLFLKNPKSIIAGALLIIALAFFGVCKFFWNFYELSKNESERAVDENYLISYIGSNCLMLSISALGVGLGLFIQSAGSFVRLWNQQK